MRMYASSEKVIFVPSWQPKKSQEWPLTFFWGFKWISIWFTIWCLKKFELLEICSQTAFQVQGEKDFAMESMSPAANTRAQCSETCWSWMCWSVAGHLNPTVSGWTQIHSPGLWIFKILFAFALLLMFFLGYFLILVTILVFFSKGMSTHQYMLSYASWCPLYVKGMTLHLCHFGSMKFPKLWFQFYSQV